MRLPRLSISWKLTLIACLAIGVALAISSAVFLAYDRSSAARTVARRLHSQAEIVAFNSATAVVFRDPESAARTLAALQSDGHLVEAHIRTPDGRLFASYVRPGAAAALGGDEPGPPGPESERFERDSVAVTLPILLEGKRVGTLTIRSDLRERDERFRTYGGVVLVVSLVALALGLLVGRAAQRTIARPILELADASHRIADENEYSLRLEPRTQDEIGALFVAFNHMLDGLQRRDAELRTTHAELERRIQEAEQANRVKDEFLATLSHELRTPLNAILGWAQILRAGDLDPGATERALETISRNALAQSQIVADILDMQRITTGKLRLSLQPLELPPIILRAIDTVSPTAEAKGIEVRGEIDSGVGPVLGDEDRLQQVMWNLLSNAVKFTPRGGRVSATLRRLPSQVEITVEDDGPGLDPEFIPFAFDRFRQADSSSTRRHGGLGLGLAIVRNLVELHGGTVAVGNRGVGTGAVFVVKLPLMGALTGERAATLDRRGASADEPVSMAMAPSLHGIRVLVVDDEPDAREIIATALAARGADVATAASAEEAMEMLRRSVPDVLLSDIEMPVEDGYSLMRRIRARPAEEGGTVPAAALTAYASTEDRMRVLDAGFQIHIPKPVQPAELVAVVASLARRPQR